MTDGPDTSATTADSLGDVVRNDLQSDMRTRGKPYLLFAGESYQAQGGAWDFCGAFSQIDHARLYVQVHPCDWAQIAIFTGDDLKIIWRYHDDEWRMGDE